MKKLALAASAILALNISSALAEDEVPNFAEDTLTGDWGGLRSAAAQNGYSFTGGLKVDALRSRGGLRDGTKSVSHLDLKLAIDLEKAVGWEGGSALINVIRDAGHGLNDHHVASLMGVTNLEVPFPTTTRLFHAWVQQSLFDDRFSILAGIYPVDSEFQTLDAAGIFIKPEYGPTAEFALTRGPSIFNNAAFGFRTKLQSADKTLYAQWALMDGIPNDPDHPRRTRIRFDDKDGAFNMVEVGWLPEAGNDQFKGHAKLAFGLWGYTVREDDQLDVANIDAGNSAGPARKRRSQGGYLLGERTFYRVDDDRFVSGFGRYSWTDGDSSPLKDALSLGIHVKGPLAARPDDILGLAWTRASLSSNFRQATRIYGDDLPTRSESAWELTYRAQLTPWLAIQPNAQWVRNPGGLVGPGNARLIGVRLDLVL